MSEMAGHRWQLAYKAGARAEAKVLLMPELKSGQQSIPSSVRASPTTSSAGAAPVPGRNQERTYIRKAGILECTRVESTVTLKSAIRLWALHRAYLRPSPLRGLIRSPS